MIKNKIILITGLHGCGKTTQIKLLKKYLEKTGRKVYVSKAEDKINLKKAIGEDNGSDNFFITLFFTALYYRQRVRILEALKKIKLC